MSYLLFGLVVVMGQRLWSIVTDIDPDFALGALLIAACYVFLHSMLVSMSIAWQKHKKRKERERRKRERKR